MTHTSPSKRPSKRRYPLVTAGLAALMLVISLLPALVDRASSQPVSPADAPDFTPTGEFNFLDYGIQGEGDARVHDLDRRTGQVAPSAAQIDTTQAMGATRATWNEFGTPHVLINHGGFLSGPAEGEAVDVARGFVSANRDLFRMDAAGVESLEVLRDSPLYDSPDLAKARDGDPVANPDVAHAVLFRQTFDGLQAGLDGMLNIGVTADGRIAWVSSSVTGDSAVQGSESITPIQALQAVAADVGFDLGTLAPSETLDEGYLTFDSSVTKDIQRVDAAALPTPTDGVRRAWEVTLLASEPDADGYGNPVAFIAFVDAEDGTVWQRANRVDHFADGFNLAQPSSGAFSGTTEAGDCGPDTPFQVGDGNQTITVDASATSPPEVSDDDITITLLFNGEAVANQDVLTSPEVLIYSPGGTIDPGEYIVRICPFNGTEAPEIPYEGLFTATPGAAAEPPLPRWRVFPTNPPLSTDENPSEDTRKLWCWGQNSQECDRIVRNTASRFPWDVRPGSAPTLTTDGNNASTAISEASFLTPDTAFDRPAPDPNRDYQAAWDNKWFESKCDPSNFAVDNDDDASTYNLFVMHNRMHDWSYFLGFTEINANLQVDNFGDGGEGGDPELGSSQAGRLTFNGRDNANQITLQDGVPPITNQYLWQPLAGAFYGTCTDGAYDMAIVAHEYGHAISNRMTGGPDTGTGPTQGQTESWSDLVFAEYFRGFSFTAGEGVNPFALAPLVTGDPEAGIRNYGMNRSPLNYSNIDYDPNGLGSPHANGEIWSATNYDIAIALNADYDDQFPSDDEALQLSCARGERPADVCPGSRQWAQLMFDGFLLQPSGSSMVDSRDAMLAGDMMRFGGANQETLWDAFGKRGLGGDAFSESPTDIQPTSSFSSPVVDTEATVKFAAAGDAEAETPIQVFVGDYEARITPIANNYDEQTLQPNGEAIPEPEEGADPVETGPEIGDTAEFLPGTYDFFVTAPGFGGYRFTLDLTAGQELDLDVPLRENLASIHNGGEATGTGVNLELIIDDTETTNWASLSDDTPDDAEEGAQVEGRTVTVDLAGDSAVPVVEVQVSAMLRPEDVTDEDPILTDDPPEEPDPGGQSRFSMLRSFDILACNADDGADCESDDSYELIFESADDAFPGIKPRPRVPEATLRPFDVTDTEATHLRLVVRDNQCTGAPAYQAEQNEVNDPIFQLPDCDSQGSSGGRLILSPPNEEVRASEMQVFSKTAPDIQPEPEPEPDKEIRRVFGLDRIETAVALSQEAFPDGAATAVLARADAFPDALAAATLTAEVDGPLLLTNTGALDDRVATELSRLGVDTIYLTGGESALSADVQTSADQIADTVQRLGGIDRFETAQAIGTEVVDLGGAVDRVIVARADEFPDALAAANLATYGRSPILLSNTDAVPQTTLDALESLLQEGQEIVVVGGTAAVSDAASTQLTDAGFNVSRLAGDTRYDTAAVILQAAIDEGVDLDPVLLASGDNFPDALTAGPAAFKLGGALGLVHPTSLDNSPETRDFLEANGDSISLVLIAGGNAAVADDVVTSLSELLGLSIADAMPTGAAG